MAKVGRPQPVQVIAGVIFRDYSLLDRVESELTQSVGVVDARSQVYDFDVSDYYRDEMGDNLKRIFYSFRDLINPETIVDIKLATNEIEVRMSIDGKRRVNIDPGYMDLHKLVLASAKFLGQKVYVGKGIYVDPTIYYHKGWKPYEWGFPDFKSGRYNDFLEKVRRLYKHKLREQGWI